MIQVTARESTKMTSRLKVAFLHFDKEKIVNKRRVECRSTYRGELTVPFISIFAIANFKPFGSRPIARQNKITCITGNAKMNNITPTLRHIRKKFFCSKARIFPLDVIWNARERERVKMLLSQSYHIVRQLHCSNSSCSSLQLNHQIGFPLNQAPMQVLNHWAAKNKNRKRTVHYRIWFNRM